MESKTASSTSSLRNKIHQAFSDFSARNIEKHGEGLGTRLDHVYRYSGERVAHLTCSINLALPNEAIVVGTKGSLKLPAPFWCSTKLETNTVCTAVDIQKSL